MPTKVKSVTVETDFEQFVASIAHQHGLSWSAALVNAAARELGYEGEPIGKHGDGLRFQAKPATRCMCGNTARFGAQSITCEVCGLDMF